jgi:hypothetical protein
MAIIGRAFAFYVKYWEHMEALYGERDEQEKEALSKHLPEREETMKQIEEVGERAGEQAAALLTACGKEIEDYFSKSLECEASRHSRESTIEKDWGVEYYLRRMGRGRGRAWDGDMRVDIIRPPDEATPAILLSFWAPGGLAGEKKLERILPSTLKWRGKDFGWVHGRVFFAEAPIDLGDWKDLKAIEQKGKALVAKTREALGIIHKRDIKKLFEL